MNKKLIKYFVKIYILKSSNYKKVVLGKMLIVQTSKPTLIKSIKWTYFGQDKTKT